MVFRGQYWFLSNFYPVSIQVMDTTYNSVEAAFQGEKAGMCGHEDVRQKIAEFPLVTTYDAAVKYGVFAKRLGRSFNMSDSEREMWDSEGVNVMREAIREKFMREDLATQLMAIDGPIVAETGNRRYPDRVWGVDSDGRGKNLLGEFLMEARADCLERYAKRDEHIFSELHPLETRDNGVVAHFLWWDDDVKTVLVAGESLHPLEKDMVNMTRLDDDGEPLNTYRVQYGFLCKKNYQAEMLLASEMWKHQAQQIRDMSEYATQRLFSAESIAVDIRDDENVEAEAEADRG